MIYVILGKLSKATADTLALPRDKPGWKSAVDRESEIRAVVEHKKIAGTLKEVVWTLGEYDVVITIDVSSPEKGGAAALALATRIGVSTTTLTGFALQSVMNDSKSVMDDSSGYGSH